MSDWRVTAVFDSLAEQEAREPENRFPHDDLSRTIAFLSQAWALIPEELQEMARWTDTEIVIESQVIDAFQDLMQHLLMGTSPKKITVERMYR